MLETPDMFIHPAAVFAGAFPLYFTSEETEAERGDVIGASYPAPSGPDR